MHLTDFLQDFRRNHHRYWGKLYKPEDVKVWSSCIAIGKVVNIGFAKLSWHVPNAQEINFAIEIFREVVEPTLRTLDGLLEPGEYRAMFDQSNTQLMNRRCT